MRQPLIALVLVLTAGHAVAEPDWLDLSAADGPLRQTVGEVAIELRMETRFIDGMSMDVPVVAITDGGREALTLTGAPSGFEFPQGEAAILELDRIRPGPEVAFTSYTGGAHCCTSVKAAVKTETGRWRAVNLGEWDGGGHEILSDADGDGVTELVSVDNAFLYAFDCYACSEAPLQILALDDGKVIDVTGEPRFRPTHLDWLEAMEARQAEYGEEEKGPGFWAGWIAAKARVGQGPEAWETFRREYRPNPDHDVEECTVANTGECPQGAQRMVPFADALRVFLTARGYRI